MADKPPLADEAPPLNTVIGKIYSVIFNVDSQVEQGRRIYELIDAQLLDEKLSYESLYKKWAGRDGRERMRKLRSLRTG